MSEHAATILCKFAHIFSVADNDRIVNNKNNAKAYITTCDNGVPGRVIP